MNKKKTFGFKNEAAENLIYCGDNLEWMKQLADESIDLCYIDPPFFSNQQYEILWGNGYERRSFEDRFSGKILNYIEWMRPRIELIHKKLKKTASIFVHCDYHASHRLRCVLDDVFGEEHFRNEIIWKRKTGRGETNKKMSKFGNDCDTILFYAKSKISFFESQYSFASEEYNEYVKKFFRHKDEDGRLYASDNLASPSPRPNLIYEYKGYKPPKYGWAISLDVMKQWDKEGRLLFPKDKGGRIRRKRYLDELKGKPVQSLWDDIKPVSSQDNERLGYPTQKPEALIKRIIQCSSKEGDLVLDCFGGGGTTAKVCAELGRNFVTGDVSPVSVKIMAERLYFDVPQVTFQIKNLPLTELELKQMNGHKFADTVCEVMGWQVNARKSGDGGIDGWADAGKVPVQIKNHSSAAAGRPDLQKFFGALGKSKKGIFVAWRFASEAREYIAKIKQEQKIEIIPIECSQVFGGLLLEKAKGEEIEKLYLERRPKNWANNVARADAHQKVLDKIAKAKNKSFQKKRLAEAG